jgi:hypothetical protein
MKRPTIRYPAIAPLAAALVLCMEAASTFACVDGAPLGEAVTLTREAGATPSGEHTGLQVLGAGWFQAVEIVKRGGMSDRTSVTIELDGEPVMSTSFALLKNAWNQLATDYIVASVRSEGGSSAMTIWYKPGLKFRALAVVRVEVEEDGVQSVNVRATMNKPGPHEHVPGQPGTAVALPAFK